MLGKLALERIKSVFFPTVNNRKKVYQVTWVSEVTGEVHIFEADSFETAQLFRSTFGLGNNPATYPQEVVKFDLNPS
jgi:hypothetical protein